MSAHPIQADERKLLVPFLNLLKFFNIFKIELNGRTGSARQRLFGGGILGGHGFLERPYGLRGMGKRGRNVGKN